MKVLNSIHYFMNHEEIEQSAFIFNNSSINMQISESHDSSLAMNYFQHDRSAKRLVNLLAYV